MTTPASGSAEYGQMVVYDESRLVVKRSTVACFVALMFVIGTLALFSTCVSIFLLWGVGADDGRVQTNRDLDVRTGNFYLEGRPALTYDGHFEPPFIFPPGNNLIVGSLDGNDYASIRANMAVGVRIDEAFVSMPGTPGLVVLHTPIASIFALPAVSFFGFFSPSDHRGKQDVQAIDDVQALELLNRLRPVSFYWTQEYCDSVGFDNAECHERQSGFIAQEVAEVLPHAVIITNFTLGNTTHNDWHDLNKAEIVPYLVSVVQALAARVANLEQQQ